MESLGNKRRIWGPEPKYSLVEKYQRIKPNELITVAGPCSIEDEDQIIVTAAFLGSFGIKFMRGGIYRAGTYPGDNFGFIYKALIRSFKNHANNNNMGCVLEVLDYSPAGFDIYKKYADVFQIGARQMQNYKMLQIVAKDGRPVFLKRNMGSNLHEFLGAAEYLLKNGTKDLTLIERGSSTFMDHVRWDLSISIIPVLHKITNIPIIVDASHGTGRSDLVAPMTYAGIAAGADGYLIEVHPSPELSISDRDQALSFKEFEEINRNINKLKEWRKK